MKYTKDDIAEALCMALIYAVFTVAVFVAAVVWRL